MADVTISQLTQGVPAGNNVVPYSTGLNTLGVPVSAMFQNAGNIGIGTSMPSHQLQIKANVQAAPDSTTPGGTLLLDRPNRNYETSLNMGTSGIKEWFFGLNNDANSGAGDTSDLSLYNLTRNEYILRVKQTEKTIDLLNTKVVNAIVSGAVIQVKQSSKTDTQSFNQASFVNVSGLSVAITPKALGSSFLVQVQLSVSTTSNQAPYIRITRNGNAIGTGDAAGSRIACNAYMYTSATTQTASMVTVPINHVDAPSYSDLTPITYQVQIYANSGPAGGFAGVNYYAASDADSPSYPRASSSIIVQEIAA